jgi:alpha-tubulin suppressor-like RCC1 family protein
LGRSRSCPHSNITQIAAGNYHVLALNADGTVWVWGDNNTGQLGDGAACGKTCVTPVQAVGLAGTAEIAGGYVHSLAETTDGTVWAWGGNSAGELGDGSTIPAAEPEPVTGVTAEH